MATEIFSWCVRTGASEQLLVSSLQAQFGDGYKQVAGIGINSSGETWPLSCNGKPEKILEIRNFLNSHVTNSFWWTNPWGERKTYRVIGNSINSTFVNGGWVEITFTFEQAFAS